MTHRIRIFVVVALVASTFVVAAQTGAQETCTILGTEADDILEGTSGDDVICGLGGNDTITGHEGDDIIYGGDGDDIIGGGMGDDVLYGEAGADTVEGKSGNDVIYGGDGDDDLAGNEDGDEIHGGDGDDIIGGGMDDDVLYGDAGADTIEGKTGNDVIYGGDGDDDLAGNEDNDTIYGDAGDDVIGGGKHDDILYGGQGVDTADGKAGTDLCAAEAETNCEGTPLTITDPAAGDIVFHIETVVATIDPATGADSAELRINGTSVAVESVTGPETTLSWDTTVSPDGLASLEVVALDDGIPVSDASIDVTIANDTTGSIDRLTADLEQGNLSVDEYVTAGARMIFGNALEDRYATGANVLFGQPVDPADPPEGTAVGMTFFRFWDDVSSAVRETIELGDLVGPIQGQISMPNPSILANPTTLAAFADCADATEAWLVPNAASLFFKAFECRTQTEHATVYWNATSADLEFPGTIWASGLFRKEALPANALDDDDAPANGTPDFIDTIGAEIDKAWDTYTSLGFPLPDHVNVYVHELGASTDIGGDPDAFAFVPIGIQFDLKDAVSQYLPRHELFHIAQQELAGLAPFKRSSVAWWGEATAEWAVHRTTVGLPSPGQAPPYPIDDGSLSSYYDELSAVLATPDSVRRSIVVEPATWAPAFGDRSYGSFILAEHLDQTLTFGSGEDNGYEAIYRTWQRIGQGLFLGVTAQSAIQAVIEQDADDSPALASVLADFVVNNYLLDEPVGSEFGYTDEAFAWAATLTDRRPGIAQRIALPPSGSHRFSEADLERGGAVYVEYTLAGSAIGSIEVVADEEPDVEYRALRIADDQDDATGPALCSGPASSTVFALEPGVAREIPVDTTCNTVTVVATYADFDNADRTATWTATRSSSPNLLTNPGFEDGPDLPFWTPGGGSDNGDLTTTTGGVRSGIYSAYMLDGNAAGTRPILEQTVTVNSGSEYTAAVWLDPILGAADGAGLRILDSARTVVAEDVQTFFGGWRRMSVTFTPSDDEVIFQLQGNETFGETWTLLWDDAYLIDGTVAADIVNGDFQAFAPFAGWEQIGDPADFAIVEASAPEFDLEARLTTSFLLLPTAIEQGPFLTEPGIQGIALTASGAGATVTVELLSVLGDVVAETSQQLDETPMSVFLPYGRSRETVNLRISVTGPPGTDVLIDNVYQVAE